MRWSIWAPISNSHGSCWKRRSVGRFQLIWREEMKPRLEGKITPLEVRGVVIPMSRSAMRDDQSPTLTPERPEIAAQETEKIDTSDSAKGGADTYS